MNKKIVIFDFEATCERTYRLDKSEIIEIGAVRSDGAEFSEFVKPIFNKKLSKFCTELTTITQEDVDAADTFKEVWPRFQEFIKDCEILSWGDYDKNQLIRDLNNNNINSEKIEDSIIKSHRNFKKEFAEHFKIKPAGMETMLLKFKIELDGTHHRGIDDAKNIRKLYNLVKNDL